MLISGVFISRTCTTGAASKMLPLGISLKLKFTMRMANEERIRVCASPVAEGDMSGAMRKAFPHLP